MLTIFSVFITACSFPHEVTPKVLNDTEKATYQFVRSSMLIDGGMMTNFHQKSRNPELATGNEVLSESQGLLLCYAAQIADQALFDEVYQFTKDHLDNGKTFTYRYDPNADQANRYTVNAAIDDLRIMKGLMLGSEVFSKRSLMKDTKKYANRFYESNIVNNQIYDFYDTKLFMKNSFITLCYLDLEAIMMLAEVDDRFVDIYDNSLITLEGGYISDEFPMFMSKYDYPTRKYSAPQGINMVEAILTALNLSYAGKCPETTITYLKEKLENGKIYARYELDGTVSEKFESTAIYALCAMLAKNIGDESMLQTSLAHMRKFTVTQRSNSLYGAFGDEKNVYSFDNLMALTALRKGVE